MAGFQFQFLLRDMYHQIGWHTVAVFLASLFAITVVTNALKTINGTWQMMVQQLQQRSKQVFAQAYRVLQGKGQQVIEQVASTAQEATSELTEEAIVAAVDRAIDVIQTASKEVRERKIPTENVALEVSVKIMGVVELKIKADVSKEEQVIKDIDEDINSQLLLSQDER